MTNSGSPNSTGWPFSTRIALITPAGVGLDLVEELHGFDDAQRIALLDRLPISTKGRRPGLDER